MKRKHEEDNDYKEVIKRVKYYIDNNLSKKRKRDDDNDDDYLLLSQSCKKIKVQHGNPNQCRRDILVYL